MNYVVSLFFLALVQSFRGYSCYVQVIGCKKQEDVFIVCCRKLVLAELLSFVWVPFDWQSAMTGYDRSVIPYRLPALSVANTFKSVREQREGEVVL